MRYAITGAAGLFDVVAGWDKPGQRPPAVQSTPGVLRAAGYRASTRATVST